MEKQAGANERYATIQLSGIKKLYNVGGETVAALNGITTNIYKGEFAALMGPSGSGKSTLMNILGCLDRPTMGSYKLDGQEVAGLSDDALAITRNRKIGFVFQNFNLLSRISALENVALPLVYAGIGRKERLEKAQHFLAAVGLGDRADHQPNELSGGQRQRVAIARALCMKPDIMLFDEPTSALDPELTGEVLKTMRELAAERMTMVVVTHEPEIAACASRQLLVRDGKITRDEGKGVIMDVV